MTTFTAPERTRGGRLVATDGRALPLAAIDLCVTAGQGLARTRLRQRFTNPHAEPLTAEYQLPLPADGAVAGFVFTIGERRIAGEVERRAAARERFEQAMARGQTGALLEQDRSALFAQIVGNIPPGAEVVVELTVDQPLAWRLGGEWEYRFPTTVAPRYLGGEDRVPDAGRIAVDVVDATTAPRLTVELAIGDRLRDGCPPSSPSHDVQCIDGDVTLAAGRVRLDRDVVVRWHVGAPEVGAELRTARPQADAPHGDVGYGLLTLVPPLCAAAPVPRDLTLLLDTSGSMSGEPLAQAKAVVAALIEGLTDRDQLQMIEFSNRPRSWRRHATFATARARAAALRWVDSLQASGGTEMHTAVLASMQSLRTEAQGQVLLVTDGLVGFEREVVQALLQRLPANQRFHVLGVGPATNRALTCAVARAGRGIEAIVCLGEEPTAAARRLDARMRAPVVVDLQVVGTALLDVAPRQLPDLFAGEPARLSLRLSPAGGTLEVRGRTVAGPFVRTVDVAPIAAGSGRPEIVTRCGRELVEDLEMRAVACLADEDARSIESHIEQLGLQFSLATRFTSWIAVTSEPAVDPNAPTRRERVPHELPAGLSAEGLGLRRAHAVPAAAPMQAMAELADLTLAAEPRTAPGAAMPPTPPVKGKRAKSLFGRLFEGAPSDAKKEARERAPAGPRDRDGGDERGGGRRTARVLWRNDDAIALELQPADAAWELPIEVLLSTADGIVHRVQVDVVRSTRSGVVAPGAVVRVVLHLPPGLASAQPTAVALHGASYALSGSA